MTNSSRHSTLLSAQSRLRVLGRQKGRPSRPPAFLSYGLFVHRPFCPFTIYSDVCCRMINDTLFFYYFFSILYSLCHMDVSSVSVFKSTGSSALNPKATNWNSIRRRKTNSNVGGILIIFIHQNTWKTIRNNDENN